jgi:hypothetical protein
MLTQGQELGALDFKDIIGGPMCAVVNAQAQAALVTTAFIEQVGFTTPVKGKPPQLVTVSFDFSTVLGGEIPGLTSDVTSIQVPILTIVPIPYIQVDDLSIALNVSLHSVSSTSFSNVFSISTSVGGGGFIFPSFSVSVTDKNTYQFGSVVDDTYSLQVTVHASQSPVPGGMGQILTIFSNIIQSQAALIQTIENAAVQKKIQAAQKVIGTSSSSSSSS